LLGLLTAGGFAIAQQNAPDLTGTIRFNVHSASGGVETLAFTVGDGGTGPCKAILAAQSAAKAFIGAGCGLCSDQKWKIQMKNLPQ
jgi:hypothetical protein